MLFARNTAIGLADLRWLLDVRQPSISFLVQGGAEATTVVALTDREAWMPSRPVRALPHLSFNLGDSSDAAALDEGLKRDQDGYLLARGQKET